MCIFDPRCDNKFTQTKHMSLPQFCKKLISILVQESNWFRFLTGLTNYIPKPRNQEFISTPKLDEVNMDW